jgi:hypothetical protein
VRLSTGRYIVPLFFVCFLTLSIPAAAQTSTQSGSVLLAADVLDLKLDVDTTVDIGGETNFFSSRHNKYAGGRIMVHNTKNAGRAFYTGSFMGFVWGKSSFLLNWEEPDLLSFPPLDSSFFHLAMPIGFDANLDLGGWVTISPYVAMRMIWLNMKVTISDEDFSGSAFKMGADAGVKAAMQLGSLRLAGGAGWARILGEDIDFKMDDSLTFNTQTNGSSIEYFVGVELK